MISFIKGRVFRNSFGTPSFVEIETNSGVGYKVIVHKRFNFRKKGEEIFLYTSYQIREDSQMLYGFEKEEEKELFEKLITISGIGPKTGISILSEYSCTQLRDIISKGDISLLSKVSGLGKKSAQKIVLELSGKLDIDKNTNKGGDKMLQDIKSALQGLGYSGSSLKEAMERAEKVCKNKGLLLEDALKLVLKG